MCYPTGVCETAMEVATMDLTGMSPGEIDVLWLEAVSPANRVFEQAAARSSKAAKYQRYSGNYAVQAERFHDEAKALFQKAREMRAQVEPPFTAEWDRRGGWTRAYLVPDGHIHKTTSCQSLHPTTLISWLPDLSGHSEDEIVEYAGVHACTFCYPSAPVEALRAAELVEKKKGQCPGSGTWEHDSSGLRYSQRRARCNHCGQTVSCTSTGKMRAHKPKVAS